MKLELKPLLQALGFARHSLLSNDFIPVLSHFCFMDDTLYAYNDVSAVIVKHQTGLDCALRGDVLLGVLEAGAGDKVEIKTNKDMIAEINAGGSKIKMPALGSSDFIFTLPNEEPNIILPFGEEVINAFKLCLITVGQDALRPEFTGITARIAKQEACFYSSDNSTVSRKSMKVLGKKEITAVLPKSTCQQALDIYSAVVTDQKKQKPKMLIGDKYVVFTFDSEPDVTIVSKLLEVESADFEKILKDQMKGAEPFDIPDEFAHAIKRAEILLSKDLDQRCEIGTDGKSAYVNVTGQLGEMAARMPAKTKTSRAVIVNPMHVSRVIEHCKTISISNGAALLLSAENYLNLIESNAPGASE